MSLRGGSRRPLISMLFFVRGWAVLFKTIKPWRHHTCFSYILHRHFELMIRHHLPFLTITPPPKKKPLSHGKHNYPLDHLWKKNSRFLHGNIIKLLLIWINVGQPEHIIMNSRDQNFMTYILVLLRTIKFFLDSLSSLYSKFEFLFFSSDQRRCVRGRVRTQLPFRLSVLPIIPWISNHMVKLMSKLLSFRTIQNQMLSWNTANDYRILFKVIYFL